jgi:hypothetical protein
MVSASATTSFDNIHQLDITIYFKKSTTTGEFLFSYYEVTMDADKGPNFQKFHTFSIYRETGISLKEAYNLLMGRSVYKRLWTADGDRYYACVQLNLKEGNEKGFRIRQYRSDFDLEKHLERLPIRELQDETLRQSLIISLKKGNLHPVTFVKRNRTEKNWIEASPEKKCIVITPLSVMKIRAENHNSDAE